MVGGSMRSTAAGPVPAGWPASGSGPAGAAGSAGGRAGGVAVLAAVAAGGPPTTWTAAVPLRAPTRASMMATPPPIPVTVPLLSTLATATLLDDQITRAVGMTLPTRSNAVASSPLLSPTLIVIEGGATWTSVTACASATPGHASVTPNTKQRRIIAART